MEGGEGGLPRGGKGGGIESPAPQLQLEGGGGAAADEGEQQGVEHEQGDPLPEPDAQARNGFDEEELEGLVVGFQRDGGAAGPERGKGEEEGGDAENVGEMDPDQALGRAIAAEGKRQEKGGGEEQGGQDQDDARAEDVAESEEGDGGDLSHGSGGAGCSAASRSMSCKSL